jgi:hypothetical protein
MVDVGLVELRLGKPQLHGLAVRGQCQILLGQACEVDVRIDGANRDKQRPSSRDKIGHGRVVVSVSTTSSKLPTAA